MLLSANHSYWYTSLGDINNIWMRLGWFGGPLSWNKQPVILVISGRYTRSTSCLDDSFTGMFLQTVDNQRTETLFHKSISCALLVIAQWHGTTTRVANVLLQYFRFTKLSLCTSQVLWRNRSLVLCTGPSLLTATVGHPFNNCCVTCLHHAFLIHSLRKGSGLIILWLALK